MCFLYKFLEKPKEIMYYASRIYKRNVRKSL